MHNNLKKQEKIWANIRDNDNVFIIAEIGKNFIQSEEEKSIEEYLVNAKELIRLAKEAGADAVKFQTHNVEDEQLNIDVTSPHFRGNDRYNWVKRNDESTPLEFWQELKKYADDLGIIFFSTPMSRGAARKLNQVGVDLWKVGSGDILDFVTLDYMAETGKPIIISSGMSTLEEVDKAINFLKKRKACVALLHCVSKYPCPSEDLNLKTIDFFNKRYDLPIGFSDHSTGDESAVAATQMGAKIIEKHFSLNRDLWGADHKVSMTPDEFKNMVDNIRNKKQVDLGGYGSEEKILHDGEAVFRPLFRKSLMAGCNIKAGEVIAKDMLYAMRPQVYAKGLPSEEYENIVGTRVVNDIKKYEPITHDISEIIDLKNMEKKKKVLVPIFNRAHYGRLRKVLKEIQNHPDLELQVIVSSSVAYGSFFTNLKHSKPNSWREALPCYIRARYLSLIGKLGLKKVIKSDFVMRNMIKDGFTIDGRVPLFFDGGSSVSMAKAVGFGMMKLADLLKKLNPDVVLINADRFEMMAVALTASYLNIPIAHNEGGDISGTIDESIRHSITKLSHIHFTATENSRKRVIQMGEDPGLVSNVGSPVIDLVKDLNLNKNIEVFPGLDISKPYLLVLFHSVTTEPIESNIKMTENIFSIIEEMQMPTLLLGSNIDAKSKEIGQIFKNFIKEKPNNVYFDKHLAPDDFYRALAKASCSIGNSSSFIREGAFFGTPTVLIGSRQNKRDRGQNVIETGIEKEEIKEAIKKQLNHGRYKQDTIFGDGKSSKKIAKILANTKPNIQKEFYNLKK